MTQSLRVLMTTAPIGGVWTYLLELYLQLLGELEPRQIADVPPDDPAALARQLGALIEDPRARANLAARALARALELTPGRMASAYLTLYRELLTTGAQARCPVPDGAPALASSAAPIAS